MCNICVHIQYFMFFIFPRMADESGVLFVCAIFSNTSLLPKKISFWKKLVISSERNVVSQCAKREHQQQHDYTIAPEFGICSEWLKLLLRTWSKLTNAQKLLPCKQEVQKRNRLGCTKCFVSSKVENIVLVSALQSRLDTEDFRYDLANGFV